MTNTHTEMVNLIVSTSLENFNALDQRALIIAACDGHPEDGKDARSLHYASGCNAAVARDFPELAIIILYMLTNRCVEVGYTKEAKHLGKALAILSEHYPAVSVSHNEGEVKK